MKQQHRRIARSRDEANRDEKVGVQRFRELGHIARAVERHPHRVLVDDDVLRAPRSQHPSQAVADGVTEDWRLGPQTLVGQAQRQ